MNKCLNITEENLRKQLFIFTYMKQDFFSYLINGYNCPPQGTVAFESSDHVRFENGQNVSGHNYNCYRRLVIENDIEGRDGYIVTLYNLDGIHPFWQNDIQMSPKRMKIVNVTGNIVELRGYGYDENALAMGAPLEAASFENYGVVLMIGDGEIVRAQLNMFDRNISIVYLK